MIIEVFFMDKGKLRHVGNVTPFKYYNHNTEDTLTSAALMFGNGWQNNNRINILTDNINERAIKFGDYLVIYPNKKSYDSDAGVIFKYTDIGFVLHGSLKE